MSDDQPYYSVEEMPYVSSLDGLEPLDVLYDNVALCCPARATFLTGLYSHHTGVENNNGAAFDPSDTLATWLDEGGYTTGLFGKYLNLYPFESDGNAPPPGWDRWVAFVGTPGYYNYELNMDGRVRGFGDHTREYSTDVLAREARAFVKNAGGPFFAFITPFGPHGPYIPAARHAGSYRDVPFPRRENFGVTAKGAPAYYQQLPEPSFEAMQSRWRTQMEMLQSVDELVKTVVTEADERPRKTIVLYLSDNGFSLGSHRWGSKWCGYEECGRIPGLIRSPGDPSGAFASIADLAPTLADFAGVPNAPTDGESLVPTFAGSPQDPDRAILLRKKGQKKAGAIPPFWGLRTQRWKYLRHGAATGADGDFERPEELYDLREDPFELQNVAADPEYEEVLAGLRARLEAERAAAPHP